MVSARLVCSVLLVLAVVVPASVAPVEPALAQEQPTPTPGANETVQHRDPDTLNGRGSIEQVRAWLLGELSSRLADGTVELTQEQYELARQLLGSEYDRRLGQLVDVAGETETTRAFERTRERQRELTNATQQYRETLSEYEQAREEGDTERARELARDLERIEERVNESAAETVAGYEQLGEQTGREFGDARENVETVAAEVSDQQAEIRRTLFVATEITVSAERERVSFLDPLAIEGRLVTENGTALTDRQVTVAVGQRTVETTTDTEGRFTLSYRPVALALDTREVTVEYVPRNESVYLGSTATLPVTVEQVTPTVTVDEVTPTSAGFAETVTVSGQVATDGVGVPAPLAMTLGGQRVATVQSEEDGTYDADVRVPASVSVGEQELTVRVALENRAIASASGATTLTVTETATSLTVSGTQTGERVGVTGTLETADGRAVPEQSVRVLVNGTSAGAARTGPGGTYETTVDLPDGTDEGTVTVRAVYEGRGTNLGAAEDETTVAVEPVDATAGMAGTDDERASDDGRFGIGTGTDGLFGLSVLETVLLAGGVALVAVLVLGGVWLTASGRLGWLAGRGGNDEAAATSASVSGDPTTTASQATGAEETITTGALLDRAHDQLAAGETNGAVVSAYLAVRRRLREGGDASRTHWEFYRDRASGLDEATSDALRDVTEGYERAAFAPGVLSKDVATRVVERASRIGQ